MNKNILKYSLSVMIFLSVSTIRSYASEPFVVRPNIKTDSVNTSVNIFTDLARKDIFDRVRKQAEREQMLDRLSRQPSDFPEVFHNAKEEYLWNERAKAQDEQEDYQRRLSEKNQNASKQ
ncbi:MAG TPA: hypothetical protein VHC47_02915 [Mucilaginibacter sp.]|nr:hypothetical protein [Mucilaginibacter sp.]